MNWRKGIDYPEWMDEASLSTLKKGYLVGDETPKNAMWEIACRVEEYLPGLFPEGEVTEKLFNYLWKGWICPSTPMWSSFRHKRGTSISCFSSFLEDNIPSIGFTLSEVMRMTQLGGGTSVYWGDVRARGNAISSGGKTNGTLSFMEIFDTMIAKVSQSNLRRGACAMYLPIDHGDIEEFLSIKDNDSPIKSLFSGVCIPDNFITKLYDGDSYSLGIWAKVLKSRSEKGLPYLFFTDNANNHYSTPDWYGHKQTNPDYFIKSSNLCVAPDTKVLTDQGDIVIKTLENKVVNVWNGEEFSEVTIRKTGTNKRLLRVKVTNGLYLDCTPEHKFYIESKTGETVVVEARDLLPGDKTIRFGLPMSHYLSLSKPEKDAWLNRYNAEMMFELIDKVLYTKLQIESITPLPSFQDTYCFTEPKRHMGVFNGILTSQCSEIFLPVNEEESFVCCVLSLNLSKYDEWCDTDAVQFAVYLGDAVMSDFIYKVKGDKLMKRAYKFARDHRPLGVGILGWHTYLQSKNLPFASISAKGLNNTIFKNIREKAEIATNHLGEVLGPCKIGNGKRRNSTLLAIAPTTSNATIQGGISPGIEPLASNFFIQKSAKGDFVRKNKELEQLLISLDKNTEEVWESIKNEDGSVHHLTFLTQDQKDVFKTFKEINQYAIIDQAADRQMFIDQGQSLNVFIPLDAEPRDVSKLYLYAHKRGLKSLYYQRGETIMNTSKASSNTLDDSCLFCQG